MASKSIILDGVVGSNAYGLATPESDVDRLGIYLEPTKSFLGLLPPTPKSSTTVTNSPDRTLHELGKFVKLALQMNPTVTELLWLPEYTTQTHVGRALVKRREQFLSSKLTRAAYLGYATQQLIRLRDRGDGSFGSDLRKRTEKHARHIYRLVLQGFEMWSTGSLTVKMEPEHVQNCREFGADVAGGNVSAAEQAIKQAEEMFDSTESVLPEYPDQQNQIDQWLVDVRLHQLDRR